MLNIYSQTPISLLTPLKLKLKQLQLKKMTKKKETLNLILSEPSEVKSIPFPVSFFNENYENCSPIDVQLIQVHS